jgi:hypothetical protein
LGAHWTGVCADGHIFPAGRLFSIVDRHVATLAARIAPAVVHMRSLAFGGEGRLAARTWTMGGGHRDSVASMRCVLQRPSFHCHASQTSASSSAMSKMSGVVTEEVASCGDRTREPRPSGSEFVDSPV